MVCSDLGSGAGATRQLGKERVHPIRIESKVWRKLPQDRAQLLIKSQNTRRQEVRERRLDAAQLLHVRNEPTAFYRKDKVLRYRSRPRLEAGSALQRVKAAIDLNGVHALGRVPQVLSLWQPFWIERPAPAWVRPASNAHPSRHSRRPY